MHVDRRVVVLSILLVVAALSWWWSLEGEMPRMGARAPSTERSDYSFSGLVVSEMSPQGELVDTLSADRLVHYPDRESSLLDNPRLVFYNGPVRAWDVVARSGTVLEADRSVVFDGDVTVAYAGEAPGQGFELYTDQLHVWPDARRAETDKAVRIVQPAAVIESVGLQAQLDSRTFTLLSQVRGTYEP
jgi:lipopolysaccharide export system protein LptC